jgi:hypothetical protein
VLKGDEERRRLEGLFVFFGAVNTPLVLRGKINTSKAGGVRRCRRHRDRKRWRKKFSVPRR